MARRISSSRPMMGSILPSRAASVRSRAYFDNASKVSSALAESAVRPLRISLIAAFSDCAETLPASSASLARVFTIASAISTRSTGTKLSPACLAIFCASSITRTRLVSTYTCPSPPETLGSLATVSSTARRTAWASPPERAIRLAASP